MNDRPGMSGAENWTDPEASVPSEEDPITAFIRSSLQAGHPPGKIAMTLEQQTPGLGRAYLGSIQTRARDMDAAPRPPILRTAGLTGLLGGGLSVASDGPAAGRWIAGREAVGDQKAPQVQYTDQVASQFDGIRDASLAELGLPLRSTVLAAKNAGPGGLLRPIFQNSKSVRPSAKNVQCPPISVGDIGKKTERRVAMTRPGWQVVNAARSAQISIREAQEQFPNLRLHNDAADAWRHFRWNFAMAQSMGPNAASAFANSHEVSHPNDPSESTMDLHNNAMGRAFATNPATKNLRPNDAANLALRSGCLQTAPRK